MKTEKTKPLASLSMDLDNLWSYMKTHGDSGWEKFPSYFEILIPQILEVLDQMKLKITFFVVGQDATLKKNREYLKQLIEYGHEVGNHSFHHEPWFHLYSPERIEKEVLDTEHYIIQETGKKPIGFRGPGFSWSSDLFNILKKNEYIYDASILPTYIGPLARKFYFKSTKLDKEEKNERKDLFGSITDGFRPVKPFLWNLLLEQYLLEIPVTTIPIIKIPFHLSYLLYISRFSESFMLTYLNIAIILCKITGTAPSFLLHPLDFLSIDQVPDLAFFPGMDLSIAHKMNIFQKVIKLLSDHFKLVNMSTYANTVLKGKKLKVKNL